MRQSDAILFIDADMAEHEAAPFEALKGDEDPWCVVALLALKSMVPLQAERSIVFLSRRYRMTLPKG